MPDLVEEGKAKAAGIIAILIGVCSLIELICGFIYLSIGGNDGSGLWCGVGLLVITLLGVLIWVKRNKTAMVFYLVMCILWLIVSLIQFVIALLAWVIWRIIRVAVENQCFQRGERCYCNAEKPEPIPVRSCTDIKTIESCFLAIMIMAAFACILTLAGSIIGCMSTCCARPEPQGVVIVQQPGYAMNVTTTQQVGYAPAAGGVPPPDYGMPQKM